MAPARNTVFDAGGPIIIGAGLAGLFTALKCAPMPCLLISPDPVGVGSSSAWAQGGMAAAVGEGDSAAAHMADTIAAGAGLVDPEIAAGVTEEARARVLDLLSFGTPFDKDESGALLQSREAAHSTNRVLRVSGDMAGKAIMDALLHRARQTSSIRILEGVTVDDLAVADGHVVGVFARRVDDLTSEPMLIRAPHTVLATGGIGGLYAKTTNPSRVRGQGLGMAARAGAQISDPEFVQFHPTGIAIERDPTPLATEALRGHGATIIDTTGTRFLLNEHPDGELAPRDIVARAIHRRVSNGEPVFLDTRSAIGAGMAESFPTVTEFVRSAGIDPLTQPIPIAPTQHYHMGGVATDAQGATSLPGLWAAGEVACTGLHGANRLASNSLLEAVVFAARIADAISATPQSATTELPAALLQGSRPDVPRGASKALREVMSTHVGVERSESGLRHALDTIAALEREHAPGARAFLNMTHTATLIAAAALQREESRGSHARLDFPEAREPAMRTVITLTDALDIREN
ncbi:MAG: L-aspartate oxidase [Pseudomonadota bacterium]